MIALVVWLSLAGAFFCTSVRADSITDPYETAMVTSCYPQKDIHIAAHKKDLPIGTVLELLYEPRGTNQKATTATVTIGDRGPFVRGRDLDVSCKLARKMGFYERGVVPLYVHVVYRAPVRTRTSRK